MLYLLGVCVLTRSHFREHCLVLCNKMLPRHPAGVTQLNISQFARNFQGHILSFVLGQTLVVCHVARQNTG